MFLFSYRLETIPYYFEIVPQSDVYSTHVSHFESRQNVNFNEFIGNSSAFYSFGIPIQCPYSLSLTTCSNALLILNKLQFLPLVHQKLLLRIGVEHLFLNTLPASRLKKSKTAVSSFERFSRFLIFCAIIFPPITLDWESASSTYFFFWWR